MPDEVKAVCGKNFTNKELTNLAKTDKLEAIYLDPNFRKSNIAKPKSKAMLNEEREEEEWLTEEEEADELEENDLYPITTPQQNSDSNLQSLKNKKTVRFEDESIQ